MNTCSPAGPACAAQMSSKCHLRPHRQEPRQRPLSTLSLSPVTPHVHQRHGSFGASSGIAVKKNKKEPEPPHRGVSLLRPHTSSHPSSKRYSCPAIGILNSPRSSSSSSSSSSCSSSSPVQTSVITGPDPLGWKLHPISMHNPSQSRAKRLSLQIPLPVIPALSTPELSPKTKPPLKPKPFRRHHSDSSAALTLEELCNLRLRPIKLSDEMDDVFSEGTPQEEEKEKRVKKIPPPVPEKTIMARQIAQLIAHSHQRTKSKRDENIYSTVMKPKHAHSSTCATTTASLNVDISCDRQRSTPHFPG
ncbi:uncharacterized protein LOC114437430 [Parambassis ranga]|uniref:Uncharacterized protein LOC114437430 n=1 Tax=Parambassis ranga TaxID=210632 RepID=A0A6P7ILJ4_9TELE|nr:uncharacterized protein LOC114437430 [Parambassis ranga]